MNNLTGRQQFALILIGIFVVAGCWIYSVQQANERAAAQRSSEAIRNIGSRFPSVLDMK